ncbi:MAG TPA: flagellar basal body-associated FliL family protein [Gaiellaceae bacterium]|nr:flagellar basal body-associated FliL family protein [Gaiellaceae bacterium]
MAKKEKKEKKGKKKKILIGLVFVLLLGAAGAYEKVLKAAPVPPPPPKIVGTLVPLTDPFTLNLAGGHYGRVSVSLLVTSAPAPAMNSSGANVITLPENDAIRALITNDLTGIDSSKLIARDSREELEKEILRDLKKSTDEPVTKVLFTDIAVQ